MRTATLSDQGMTEDIRSTLRDIASGAPQPIQQLLAGKQQSVQLNDEQVTQCEGWQQGFLAGIRANQNGRANQLKSPVVRFG